MLNHFHLHLFVSTSYIMACFDDYPSQKLKNNQSFINVDLSYPYANSCFGMLWNYTAWLMLIGFCGIRFMNDFESVCEYWSINVFEKHFKMPPNISYIIDHFGWHHNAIFELNDCFSLSGGNCLVMCVNILTLRLSPLIYRY
jgi:hypothetical protein